MLSYIIAGWLGLGAVAYISSIIVTKATTGIGPLFIISAAGLTIGKLAMTGLIIGCAILICLLGPISLIKYTYHWAKYGLGN